jgi:predicted Zn-dependent protease
MRVAHLAAVLGCLSLAGCARNPATGANQLMLVSESQEIAMGQEYDQQIIATIGLYPDSAIQRYVAQLGAQLAAHSERPNLPWTFRVVDDPAVNAFAVPGGHIYVTRGIMAHLNSEAELAAVIGHEIGHVTARHTAQQMTQQQLLGLGLALGAAASSTVAQYSGVASQALGVLMLKFSRDDENQADQLGLRYMSRGRYDVREMPAIFVMLDRVSSAAGGGRLPNWLATHPAPQDRHQRITAAIAALPHDFTGTMVNRDGYIRRLDGLMFGENPREGYFVGADFFQPDLRFKLTFPSGWATQNGKQAVIGVSAARDAAIELSLASEASADAGARAFFAKEGMTAGTLSRQAVNGLAAISGPFAATTSNGPVRGTALFVDYDGAVYRLIGYAPEANWAAAQPAIVRTLQSFQRLTDPAALSIQPRRLDIWTIPRRITLADLARQQPSPQTVEALALINQVEPGTTLEVGRLVKWVR